MEGRYSREEVKGLVNRIFTAYNSAPNPGIVGVEEIITDVRVNGQEALAERILPIILEINVRRPFVLDESCREEILSKLGY